MLRAIGVLAISCLAGCFIAGCTDTSSSLTVIAVPTLITVDPRAFLGSVRCGAPELQSYVVALTDVSPDAGLFPVSQPATCPNPTSFTSPPIVVGDEYIAEIDGYDRPLCDAVHQVFPTGCVERSPTNDRVLIDHATGTPVPPRYRWQCGERPSSTAPASALRAPARALYSTEVFLRGCAPVTDVLPADASAPDAPTDGEADAATDAGTDAATEAGDEAADSGDGEASPQPPDAADAGG